MEEEFQVSHQCLIIKTCYIHIFTFIINNETYYIRDEQSTTLTGDVIHDVIFLSEKEQNAPHQIIVDILRKLCSLDKKGYFTIGNLIAYDPDDAIKFTRWRYPSTSARLYMVLPHHPMNVVPENILNIVRMKYKSLDINDGYSETLCSICYEDFDENTSGTITLPCRHRYHYLCMGLWFTRCEKQQCPQCRTFVTIEYEKA